MANTTLIKSAIEYTSYDTSSGDVSDTLTAVIGKTYQVANKGSSGNTLTIHYDSESMKFEDGESGELTWDGTVWTTQFSTVGGAVSLFPGRKFAEPLSFSDIETPGWYKIVLISDSSSISRLTTGKVKIVAYESGAGASSAGAEFGRFNSGSTDRNPILNLLPEVGFAVGSPLTSAILGIRIGYGASGEGAYIEAYLNPATSLSGNIQLADNLDFGTAKGAQLIQPILTDGKLPSGAIASYLEAGTVVTWVVAQINPFYASTLSSTSVFCTWCSPTYVKRNASAGTITLPSSGLRFRNAGGTVEITSGLSISNVLISPDGHSISFRLNADSGTPFASLSNGPITVQALSSDGSIVWS